MFVVNSGCVKAGCRKPLILAERLLTSYLWSGRRFRGIRHMVVWDASPEVASYRGFSPKGLLLDTKFREGFACLQKYGLSFDAWLYHPQLMELVDLARAFPDTPIILNHIGGLVGVGPYARKRDQVF